MLSLLSSQRTCAARTDGSRWTLVCLPAPGSSTGASGQGVLWWPRWTPLRPRERLHYCWETVQSGRTRIPWETGPPELWEAKAAGGIRQRGRGAGGSQPLGGPSVRRGAGLGNRWKSPTREHRKTTRRSCCSKGAEKRKKSFSWTNYSNIFEHKVCCGTFLSSFLQGHELSIVICGLIWVAIK